MLHRAMKQLTSSPDRRLVGVLALSSALGLAMLALRFYYSGMRAYTSLPWDLFLAWVPLPLAFAVSRLQQRAGKLSAAMLATAVLWLLFFPNAPYLVTQFMHLHPSYAVSHRPLPEAFTRAGAPGSVPLWYDVLMLSTYAWTGLLLGFLSLHLIHRTANRIGGRAFGWGVAVAATWLCAFGVSLGRFQRWNSWDVFARPEAVMSDVLDRVINPLLHARTSAVTLVLGAFLLLGYLSMIAIMRLDDREESRAPEASPL